MMDHILPEWARLARLKWTYTGQKRPPMADIPEEGQESVWDYPRPPIIQPDPRTISVRFQNRVLAHSRKAFRVLETAGPPTIYIPFEDVTWSHLNVSHDTSKCEWKGIARYWTMDFGNIEDQECTNNCAWDYPTPFPEFSILAGYLAFFPTKLTCLIDNDPVFPQPGGLYGGWITESIVGPFKGEPGTEGW